MPNRTDATGLISFSDIACAAAAIPCVVSITFVPDNAVAVGFAIDFATCSAAVAVCGTAKLIDIVDDTLGHAAADFLSDILGAGTSTSEVQATDGVGDGNPIIDPNATSQTSLYDLCMILNSGICEANLSPTQPDVNISIVPDASYGNLGSVYVFPDGSWLTSDISSILFAQGDSKEVRDAGRTAGIKVNDPRCRRLWGNFIEDSKEYAPGTKNERGDYIWDELLERAEEFLAERPDCRA